MVAVLGGVSAGAGGGTRFSEVVQPPELWASVSGQPGVC